MATKKDILEPGSTFGRYRIERRLGAGGMGAVYEAVHTGLGKRVAIKALLPEMADEPELQIRFLREGESAARIRHPHVVDIYDVGTQDDITYLVMEYLEGSDLARLLKKERELSVQRAVDIMLPVTAALLAAHERGVIHRDLKPANIFLAEGPHGLESPKVLDFGISKLKSDAPSEQLTTTGALLGTPYYMSPEQAAGAKNLDVRSDQYSLGVMLYQCVTGQKPFQADSMYQILHRIVQGEFEPPRAIKPELPIDFERVLMTAMATKPDDRFPTLAELGQAFLPFASARVRARWEPIFGGELTSADLPSTYKQPAPAPLAEPAGGITQDGTGSALGAETLSATSRTSKWVLAAAGLFLLAGGVLFAAVRGETPAPVTAQKIEEPPPKPAPPPPPPPVAKYEVSLETTPARARIVLDGEEVGTGKLERSFEADGTTHVVEISAKGYETKVVKFEDGPPAEQKVVLVKTPKRQRRATRRPARRPPPPPPPRAVPEPKRGANDALIIR